MLDDLFAEIRQVAPQPSEALMARIAADAATHMPRPEPAPQGIWATLWDGLGGWIGAGGLAAATVAGLWIGIAPPDGLADTASGLWGTTTSVALMPEADFLGLEG